MKRAGEDREKQNKEFQSVIADQRATQKLLEASLGILKGFYDKAALVQKASSVQTSGQAPPPGFKSYEKNKKSGGVMGMMQGIIETLESLINENTDLHKACDFTVKNFEIRQQARDDEIDALREGLATFSGASFSAFLERGM